ncbi:MAG: hypothetical protein ABL982_02520 [Vicinamibacterales bacterium]
MAVIESYTFLASRAELLLGAYSRFQWHHPGPLVFYLLAPFYVLAGARTAGLHAGAAAIAIGSLALVAAVLVRRRASLAVLVGGSLALLSWRAAEATASPWNPHVPLLPMAALVMAAADVTAGRAWLLPAVALLASLAGQAHIAMLPCALALGAVPFVRAVVGAVVRGHDRVLWRSSLFATLLTLLVVWALPLYDQFTGTPRGNITELWSFFVEQTRPGQTLSVAVSAWADMLSGVLRPDFYVAHGWPFVESPVLWAEWVTLGALALVALLAWRGLHRRDLFDAALGGLLLISAVVSLWSTTRIAETIFDHDIFWMATLGALILAVAADLALSTLAERLVLIPGVASRVVCALLLGAAAVAPAAEVDAVARRSMAPTAEARIAEALADDLDTYMARQGIARALVTIDQDAWGVAAGAILALQKRGTIVSVEEDWVVMFTPAFRATGREDAVINVVMPPEHLRLTARGVVTVSSHDPIYAHVERARVK